MKFGQKMAIISIRAKFRLLTLLSKKRAAKKAVLLFCTPQQRAAKVLPAIFKEADQLHFEFNGITIRGYRWSHPAKHKVLILHGFDSTAVNFEQYVRPLLQKGYEVLAVDAPAHGQSGGELITALIYRDMILHIDRHYGPIQSFLAHSMGGLALALAMEKIKHDAGTRLALIAPATESVTAFDNFFKFLHINDDRVRSLFNQFIVEITGQPLSLFSITRAIQHINASVLWIHDDSDKITPLSDTLKIKEQNYPDLKFVVTHGLGHRRIYRDKKVVTTVVDFL